MSKPQIQRVKSKKVPVMGGTPEVITVYLYQEQIITSELLVTIRAGEIKKEIK